MYSSYRKKSFNFGENGVTKIGTGDWNDGFSTVGNKGKGESVWLRIFLIQNIRWIYWKFCKRRVEEGKRRFKYN